MSEQQQSIVTVAVDAMVAWKRSGTFDYRVPPFLADQISPGQLVWVPLRHKLVQGVVLSSLEASPHPLRDIVDVVAPDAHIPPLGIQLARWIAETYRAPIYQALQLFFPTGVSQSATALWSLTDEGKAISLDDLKEDEQQALSLLQEQGEMSEIALARAIRKHKRIIAHLCTRLAKRGLIAWRVVPTPPAVQPHTEQLVGLLIPKQEHATVLESLGKAPRQRIAVEWLIRFAEEQGENIVSARALCDATGVPRSVLYALEQKGIIAIETNEVYRRPTDGEEGQPPPPDQPPTLTNKQRHLWKQISEAIEQLATAHDTSPAPADHPPPAPADHPPPAPHLPFLLHGITGSGKTEIYLRAVARILRLGMQALVLVPEIALTTQVVRRFAARFPDHIAVFHSRLSPGERYDEWRRVRRGEASLVIGSRSAVGAPFTRLGLVVVDEEHEPSYKNDATPRYHARDVALQMGVETGAVILLGSATPSIESYYAAQTGRATLLELRERVTQAYRPDGTPYTDIIPLPHTRIVDMRRELWSGNISIFSRALQEALQTVVEKGQQAMLFINRRGAATFVLCRDCGHVLRCPSCDSSLTMHEEYTPGQGRGQAQRHYEGYYPDQSSQATSHKMAIEPQQTLICHSCSYHVAMPSRCPECASKRIKSFGAGTQRVEQEVARLLPTARLLRWDSDTAVGKGIHGRFLSLMLDGKADVLIGTQMIAKGLDLPNVSLVGVIAADTALHLPDFRCSERTFQLLTQVAGRAGRRTADSQVLIQSYNPEHYALQAAQEHDYHQFYASEIAFRQQAAYPPLTRMVRLLYTHSKEHKAVAEAARLANELRHHAQQLQLANYTIVGPAPAFHHRVRKRWRYHLFLVMGEHPNNPPHALAKLLDAVGDMRGWTLDVDPMHVL